MKRPLPINSAARNCVWAYPHIVPPRFAGAPAVVEVTRSHEAPDVLALPGGADVAVEFYGGAYSFWLDGEKRRVYVRRFEYVSFTSEEEARHAFLTLWREVEGLESAVEVERAAGEWFERRRRK
jgi:poly(3-hydroxybutyrate) depolymerase